MTVLKLVIYPLANEVVIMLGLPFKAFILAFSLTTFSFLTHLFSSLFFRKFFYIDISLAVSLESNNPCTENFLHSPVTFFN